MTIGRGAVVLRAIVDKHCKIPAGLEVGVDPEADRERFHVSPGGVVVVTQEMLNDLEPNSREVPVHDAVTPGL